MGRLTLASIIISTVVLIGCSAQHPPKESTRPGDQTSAPMTNPANPQPTNLNPPSNTILANPAQPDLYVSVFTFIAKSSSKEHLLNRWQFSGRNPQSFNSPNGLEGVIAEGELATDKTKRILAVGCWGQGLFEQVVMTSAPLDRFAQHRSLFEAILKTYRPQPDVGK